jgi:lipopolysaccharide transport system ATP-binding protein
VDETLSVGDASFQAKSSAAIEERILSNQTVVLVSHNIATLKELCDRVVWIDKGVTIAQGPTEEIIEQYNQHIAKSIGKRIWK